MTSSYEISVVIDDGNDRLNDLVFSDRKIGDDQEDYSRGSTIPQDEGIFQFWRNCREMYDRKVMVLIALQFINEGGNIMTMLACTLIFA